MRIPKTWVPLLTKKILNDLISRELIAPLGSLEELTTGAEKILMDELIVEDRVNDEVREILKKYATEIEKGRVDYRRMFELTKKKIVEERGIII